MEKCSWKAASGSAASSGNIERMVASRSLAASNSTLAAAALVVGAPAAASARDAAKSASDCCASRLAVVAMGRRIRRALP